MELRQNSELTVRDLLAIYRKRRRIIYGTVLLMVLLCAVYCTLTTRRYEATGTVQIQKESSSGLGLDSLMSDSEDASGALEGNIAIQTQANILESQTLALRTIEKLNMEQTQDFQPHWSPIGWALGLISPKGSADAKGVPLEEAPGRRTAAVGVFEKNLIVKPIAGTRLLQINYLNPDPKLAAAVVNELTQELMDYSFQTRYNATTQASTWLTGQLGELRKQSEDLQSKVVDLERQSGVYSLGTVDAQGREQAYSGVLDRLQQATVAMTQAEQNRILKGAVAHAAATGDAEMLSGLAGNGASGGTMNNSLLLIQNLRQQEATEQGLLQESEAKYGSSYPKLSEIRGNIAGLNQSIQDEVTRIKQRAQSDYDVAVQAETSTKQQYDAAKDQADKLNDKAIEYAIMHQEADESRTLYEDLLKRLKEAGVLEGLKSSNITVVDPGRPPAKPKKPNVPIYMAVALAVGFFLGCAAALLADSLDNKVGGIAEVEHLTGQNLLGATPLFDPIVQEQAYDGNSHLTSLDEPQSTYAEAIRSIRTAVLLTGGGGRSRVILVTSSIPGEGKTTFAANLAVVMAQSNRKVLLVDMDLRRGTLRHRMNLPAGPGLSELLAVQQKAEMRSINEVPRLDILLAGTPPPNPSELLDSHIGEQITAWRASYDYVILDGAPLLPVTDSVIVSPLVDVTLLLARTGLTEKPQLQRSFRLMTQNTKHFVGVILNGLRPEDENYYGYYGYRKYSYHYGEDGNGKTK